MDTSELQKLAQHTRLMREIGISLVVASSVLAIFLLIPWPSKVPTQEVSTTATSTTSHAFDSIALTAKAAVVYDLSTRSVLFSKNADAQLPLASLTKLMTVYAALSRLNPETVITITPEATRLDAPHAFKPGQTFLLKDLARLTLTASLNDGAASIAEAAAKSDSVTQAQMLAGVAQSLDLSQTYAINGSGLDETTAVSGGYGSARDLAILAGALAEQAPLVAAATTKKTATASSQSGISFTVTNTDPMVNTIPGLLLSKTGFTDLAGGNLALVFDAGLGHPVAVVVLGSTKDERFTDSETLVKATFTYFADTGTL